MHVQKGMVINMTKIAVLSNINMDPVISAVEGDIIKPDGYGSVFEELFRPDAAVYTQNAQHIYLILDMAELLVNCTHTEERKQEIDQWFQNLNGCLKQDKMYFISDADCRYDWFSVSIDGNEVRDLEFYWYQKLRECCAANPNVHIFPLKRIVEQLGKREAYTDKMWYLGRIPFGAQAREAIAQEIAHCEKMLGTPKKVLLLDLDNTLWGGVIGEGNESDIQLGNEKTGLIYKDLQRVIKRMKDCGVVLGIVSKNNPEDALKVIREHPHMVLREEDFAILKLNWEPKDQNIRAIAQELNLGTDSMVFFDDNPAERALVQSSLPEVTVPDFPSQTEQLPKVMLQIFRDYFEKWVYTKEDTEKTAQYRANAKRKELQESQTDYAGFLKSLDIRVKRVDAVAHRERLLQLLNKTNQFNLTTVRYTMAELEAVLHDREGHQVYLFEVSDRFGNNGITAAVIAGFQKLDAEATVAKANQAEIENFVMSCRIMGRMIEHMILDYVEKDVLNRGYAELKASYVYTPKSKPVEHFYEDCGYKVCRADATHKEYLTELLERKEKEWYGSWEEAEIFE